MYDTWKNEFFGVGNAGGVSIALENHYGEAKISFSTTTDFNAKHAPLFIENFFGLRAKVHVTVKKSFWDRFRKWKYNSKWLYNFSDKIEASAGTNQETTLRRGMTYEILYAYSYDTKAWYILGIPEEEEYTVELHSTRYATSHWGNMYDDLPKIGDADLNSIMAYFQDTYLMVNSLSKVLSADMAEAKQQQEDTAVLNKVRDGLIEYLSQTLIQNHFGGADEKTQEELKALIIRGDLELESLDICNLDVKELIDEVSSRIPEDQQQAFRERTKELINAYTSA